MTTIKRTYCRICEARCGLTVEVDEETQRVRAVRPDRDNPVSKGYCCVKGLGSGAMHDDEERLNYPMKRVGSTFERITWKRAIERARRQGSGALLALGDHVESPIAQN